MQTLRFLTGIACPRFAAAMDSSYHVDDAFASELLKIEQSNGRPVCMVENIPARIKEAKWLHPHD